MPGGNEKVKLKQTCSFQRVTFLLPPGIKGLMSGMSYDIQSELSFFFAITSSTWSLLAKEQTFKSKLFP